MPIPPPAASDVDDVDVVDGSVIDARVVSLGVMENAWTATTNEKRTTRSSLFIMMIVAVAVEEEDIGCIRVGLLALGSM